MTRGHTGSQRPEETEETSFFFRSPKIEPEKVLCRQQNRQHNCQQPEISAQTKENKPKKASSNQYLRGKGGRNEAVETNRNEFCITFHCSLIYVVFVSPFAHRRLRFRLWVFHRLWPSPDSGSLARKLPKWENELNASGCFPHWMPP